MVSVNKVILVGNLGRDPEIRGFSNGNQVCFLSLATSTTWTDESGDRRQTTEWHRVAVFNKNLIELARQQLKKGNKVYAEGQLRTNKYTDRQGMVRYSTQIVVGNYRGILIPVGNTESDNQIKPVVRRDPNPDSRADLDSRSGLVQEHSSVSTESYLKYLRKLEGELEGSSFGASEKEIENEHYGYSWWSGNQGSNVDYDDNLDDVDSDWYLNNHPD